jgi:polysaccharide pyruvyl transferase WcaK-like protein
MAYGLGAGPLDDPSVQQQVQRSLEGLAAITVREREAQRVLENAGVQREIVVAADPAFLLEPEPFPADAFERKGFGDLRRLILVSVREPGPAAPDIREEHYHAMLAYAADFMIDRLDADLVFVPMEPGVLDTQQAYGVMARMAFPRRATVLRGDYRSSQVLDLVGHAAFAVGMRLHFLIFAALQRVPYVALPYAGKVTGLLKMMDLPVLTMDRVNTGHLIAHLDRSWDERDDLRAHIDRFLPGLQEQAQVSNRIAVGLLRGAGAPRLAA